MERCDNISENSTLDELVRYFLDKHVKNFYEGSTYKSYKTKMDKYVLPYIGGIALEELRKTDIQKLMYTLLGEDVTLSANSVCQVYSILHKVLNFAVDMELVCKNVSSGIKLPVQKKYIPQIYSKSEVKRLLDKATDSFLYIPVSLAVKIGLRRSEILALQWKDFSPNDRTLIIRKRKSQQSARILKIPNTLSIDLIRCKEDQRKLLKEAGYTQTESTLIVCKSNGDPYNPTYISRKFSEFLAENNLPAIRFHDCRHTYSTHAHNSGMPIKHLSMSLGHSTAAITVENYVHIKDEYTL